MSPFSLRRHFYVLLLFISSLLLLLFFSRSTVRAAHSGATVTPSVRRPLVHLKSPQTLEIQHTGSAAAVEALKSGTAKPTALAAADFNADGAMDVVAGYGTPDGGVLTLLIGNQDAYAPKDTTLYQKAMHGDVPATFLPKAAAYTLPVSPDLILTGDFNRDGKKDVLVAARGGNLYLLSGDGHGKLNQARMVLLDGPVRAVMVPEASGVTDSGTAYGFLKAFSCN